MRPITCSLVGIVLAFAGIAHAANPITVWSIGDSITAGTIPGGYRRPLVETLEHTYGLTVTTLGTQTDTSMEPPDQPHEGHGGWRIDQLCDNLLGFNNVDATAHGGYWLTGGHGTGRSAIDPQFITVMAGINDIDGFIGNDTTHPMSSRSDTILNTLEQRMIRLVDTLATNRPQATILLTGCIPYANGLLNKRLTGATAAQRQQWAQQDHVSVDQEVGVNHWVILFNNWLATTYVPRLQARGQKVYYVEVYPDFILPDGSVRSWDNKPPQNTNGPAGYGDYGLHPNAFGYRLIGQTLAKAIDAHLSPAPTPH